MDYSKLRGKIREVYMSESAFSKALGMNRVSLSKRLNGKAEWSSAEIAKACEALNIPLEDNYLYFFTPAVKIS